MQQFNISTASVIGLGYIGLPTAAMLASRKIKVIGVDVNQHAVDTINQGKIHIVEPDLDMLVHASVTQGYLRATTKPEPADVFLIAVPTPFIGDHAPDLSYVQAAVESIAPVLEKGNIIILESTSPVGTTEKILDWLSLARPDLRLPVEHELDPDINIAYCPERVLPGHVVRELVENDRIIGGLSDACSKRAADVYRIFVTGKLLISNARTAEMCKLTENAFRDINIAFANELSMICDKLDINPWELIKLANHHPRVNILQPGCGVGGHCIAVDPWFIVDKTPNEARLIRAAREVNDHKPDWVLGKIRHAVASLTASGLEESRLKVAVLGLAFKPNIDDLRESPALHIAKQFAKTTTTQLLLVEPNIRALPKPLANHQLVSLNDAITQADILVLLVNHREFAGVKHCINKKTLLVDAIGIDFI
ncbi:UDP-N-acetyl-D-mannosamine dehydrogenase [Crenothrix polyspora]|uniref:UDP-N-acetyl-D-mannosaminuronic acid dehydrogenase n=1 Tax=Crenothrix polyspora TaxID=360316 RepID=A0A1R4H2Y5_9GAMM|nr:UDP-N-acetyl-D-mannosamine dehydrogenase [Crenothrix polyspora]SJM90589.1 UDP-N-acetyl-D-mannosaminuronic acid dehydrogenase [Crenothrix polyspora]